MFLARSSLSSTIEEPAGLISGGAIDSSQRRANSLLAFFKCSASLRRRGDRFVDHPRAGAVRPDVGSECLRCAGWCREGCDFSIGFGDKQNSGDGGRLRVAEVDDGIAWQLDFFSWNHGKGAKQRRMTREPDLVDYCRVHPHFQLRRFGRFRSSARVFRRQT